MKFVRRKLAFLTFLFACTSSACTQQPATETPGNGAIVWVQTAAEYEALSIQAYNVAAAALADATADTSWSALPDQTAADKLPTAIIFDVDETLVSNAGFQAAFEPPFENYKLEDWNIANKAVPVPGAAA